jgi:serine kinase of HPr protein (carbohydrate metabolism regulator)
VADDVVVLEGRGTALYGHGHQRVRDWIAPRGRGLLRAESLLGAEVLLGEARVDCILRLVRNSRCEAADEDGRNLTVRRIVGVDLPCWSLAAGGGSRRVAERVMAVIGGFRPLPDGSASDHGQRHRKGKRVGLKRSSGAECGWDVDSTGG